MQPCNYEGRAEVKLTYEEVEYTEEQIAKSTFLQHIQSAVGGERLWCVTIKCDDPIVMSKDGDLSWAWGRTLEAARKKLINDIIIGRDIHAKTMRAYSKALKLIDEQKGAE
jgi:hypothetical protein